LEINPLQDAIANNALNHDRPHLRTAVVREWSVLHRKSRGLRRENAVVVRHISAALWPNKRTKAIGKNYTSEIFSG